MRVHHAHGIALAAVLSVVCGAGPLAGCTGVERPLEESLALADRGSAGTRAEGRTLDELRALAEQGDAEAQLDLGEAYAYGRAVAQDGAEALRWYRMAADQGHAFGQYGLGVMYAGEPCTEADADAPGREVQPAIEALPWNTCPFPGVLQDFVEAERWFRLAAGQGNGAAQVVLGRMYADGRGIPPDEAEAVRWFRLAADQGYIIGQRSLGVLYRDGRGVLRNFPEAVRWFRRAADQGDANAQYNLGSMYLNGRGVPPGRCRSGPMVSARSRPRRRGRAGRPRGDVRKWPGRSSGLRRSPHVVQPCRRAILR